jgi:hypothetical protein
MRFPFEDGAVCRPLEKISRVLAAEKPPGPSVRSCDERRLHPPRPEGIVSTRRIEASFADSFSREFLGSNVVDKDMAAIVADFFFFFLGYVEAGSVLLFPMVTLSSWYSSPPSVPVMR